MVDNVTLDGIGTAAEYDLISLYDQLDDVDDPADNNSPFQYANASCKYYEANDFTKLTAVINDPLSCFHLNCRGLSANWESFKNLLCDLHGTSFSFDVIGISEIYICRDDTRTSLAGYHELILRCRDDGIRGGVGLYLKSMIHFIIREDISVFIPHDCESLFVEIINNNGRNVVVGVVYRPSTEPHADVDIFASNMEHIMDTIQHENKLGLVMGDMNIDLLKFEMHPKTDDYLEKLFSQGFFYRL